MNAASSLARNGIAPVITVAATTFVKLDLPGRFGQPRQNVKMFW
jgi:hypothetical protein